MLCQVVIRTICDTPKLAPSKWEQELNIGRCLTIERKLLFLVISYTHLSFFHAKRFQPINTELFPICKPLQIRIRLTEELKLHLLKLTCTECKVTRCDLVTERLSDLSNTKWDLLARCTLYILKVYKNTLCCLRTKIYGILRILSNALECLKHQVELTDLRKVLLATAWTANFFFFNIVFHLLVRPCINTAFYCNAIFCHVVLDHLICTETLMTLFTIHQRIGEASQMTGCHPCLRIHQNRAVNTYIVRIFTNKFLPPSLLYIILKLNA